MTRDRLYKGDSLKLGEGLVSPDGQTTFTLQSDGNLCLCVRGLYIWGTQTNGRFITRLDFQDDGNIVLRDEAGLDVWDPRRTGHPGTHGHDGRKGMLRCQDDNNVCCYFMDDADGKWELIWATGTTRVRFFRKISFENAVNNDDQAEMYPMIREVNAAKSKIWNGADDGHFKKYWAIWQGETKEVDFGHDTDTDNRTLSDSVSNRGMQIGVNVTNVSFDRMDQYWYTYETFRYDPNEGSTWMFRFVDRQLQYAGRKQ